VVESTDRGAFVESESGQRTFPVFARVRYDVDGILARSTHWCCCSAGWVCSCWRRRRSTSRWRSEPALALAGRVLEASNDAGAREERQVRLGVMLGYFGAGTTAGEQLELVREAERLGYDSAWVAEAYGSDAATVLAWLAAQTAAISLGSAVFQIPARSPAMTAMTAATLDQLSGGRFRLGLGLSGPQVAEGWHGQRYARPMARTRDYVSVVRMALERRRVAYQGETLELPLPDGPGKALKLTITPAQPRLPIYLGAMGPKNLALAGEVADGWLGFLFAPEHAGGFRDHLAAGAARAGRDLDGFDVAPNVQVHISDDLAAARDAMRPFLALYIGGMGSRERNFYTEQAGRYGFEAAARQVQEHYLAGDRAQAMAALPDELIDLVTLCGPAARVRERLAAHREAGVGTLIAAPSAWTHEDRLVQLRRLAELAA
jgi:F420-dependent oxidoreductase-like protein